MNNLIGLHSVKKIYDQLSKTNQFSHAYLLYGTKGSGKTTVALEYSKLFLDKKYLTTNSQIDFLWLQPSEESAWIRLPNINGHNKETDQPSIKDFLLTPPLTHNFKVVVIEDAHRLTLEAAHALLKILEEPPYFAKFILTTSYRNEVLPTIISRCININCALPSIKELNEKWPFITPVETIFSNNTPGRRIHIQNSLNMYQKLHEILIDSSKIPKLKTAEKFRIWCDQYAKHTQLSTRQALSEGLEYVALWFLYFKQHQKAQKICQAHKLTRFNSHVTYLIDSLILEIL